MSTPQPRGAARKERFDLAQKTLKIIEDGFYSVNVDVDEGETIVHIQELLDKAKTETTHYHYEHNIEDPSSNMKNVYATTIQVRDVTSIHAALDLASMSDDGHSGREVGVLNFASAKNPGGGFRNGSMAQEESLCYSSLLYPTLQQYENRSDCYYSINRQDARGGLYTDCAIFSPNVPILVDRTEKRYVHHPVTVSFLTIPAPNRGAVEKKNRESDHHDWQSQVYDTLSCRIHRALSIFAEQGCKRLVLGAFGCGVFRNDPKVVAQVFRKHLEDDFHGVFETIVFAVVGKPGANFSAFKSEFP